MIFLLIGFFNGILAFMTYSDVILKRSKLVCFSQAFAWWIILTISMAFAFAPDYQVEHRKMLRLTCSVSAFIIVSFVVDTAKRTTAD